MKFELDYALYQKEQVWDWLIDNVGPSLFATMNSSVGDGWELSIVNFDGTRGKVRITIYDVSAATAFALRYT